MAQIDKLIERFKTIPNDFEYVELKNLLENFGYIEKSRGKTSGSRFGFIRASDKAKILGHKPHGGNSVSQGLLKQIKSYLEQKGDI